MDLSRYQLEKLREERDFALFRAHPANASAPVLLLAPTLQNVGDSYLRRFEHEQSIAEDLDSEWAIRPLSLVRYGRRMALTLQDPGGHLWSVARDRPFDLASFLRVGIGLAGAIRNVHERGLIHKDVRPANVFVTADRVLLTGFAFASRLPRERQALVAPEALGGDLTYIAPERTGRLDRSIDARSDLYSLGISLYEMSAGAPPFTTADPTELIHCHVARAPPSLLERVRSIPKPVEAIISKLLSKSAEDRYQTAAGVEFDLRRCLKALVDQAEIPLFELATADMGDQLLIPERLYNRDAELAAMISSYEHVANQGRFEFVLVSGPSGIGKSSVVNELRRVPQSRRGLLAQGRSDPFTRDVPYASLAQAFQGLLRQILCQDDFQIDRWRESLQQALESSGQLLVDLIPELALIIGKQPALVNVPPQEERSRFFPVFRRFLGVFARPEHPLVLYLDNLQWLDAAALELLERIVSEREIPHLLLIGTCRTDEPEALMEVRRLLSVTVAVGKAARELSLAPLGADDLRDLIAEALHSDGDYVRPLADLVHLKTQGNCFFVRQFLTALHAEGLLQFNRVARIWHWDIEGIRAKGITDNVATLMAAKLARYQAGTLTVLKYLSCLGPNADSEALAKLLGVGEQAIVDALRDPLADDLIHRIGVNYNFAHDRVREASYALIPRDQQAHFHLRIARFMVDNLDQSRLEEDIFNLLSHYQKGLPLIESESERMFLAHLNLVAGKRAKAATAYESALRYFADGRSLLNDDSWESHHDIRFGLELYESDCKFITGDVDDAQEQLRRLVAHCIDQGERALVVGRQVMLYTFIGRIEYALELAIECLAKMGFVLPIHPSDEAVRFEFEELLKSLAGRPVESLLDLPPMQDAGVRAIMELLGILCGPAASAHLNLLTFVQFRMIQLSLQYGNTDESAHAYAGLTRVMGWSLGTIDLGHSFGRLALRLVEERSFNRGAERVFSIISGCMAPYMMSLKASYDLAARAAEVARERGGMSYAGYGSSVLISFLFDSGEKLHEVQRRAEAALANLAEQKFYGAAKMVSIPLMLVRALRGLTHQFDSFNDQHTNEVDFERSLMEQAHRHSAPRYWTRKLQLRYHSGDFETCLRAIQAVKQSIVSAPVYELTCEFWFYSGLAQAAVLTGKRPDERGEQLDELLSNHRKLAWWAARHPINFADRACLVGAEVARLEGRTAEAGKLYEEAIRLATEYGFIQNAALANELAASFYRPLGLCAIADAYTRNARAAYQQWGAEGKVRQIDQRNPHLTATALARRLSAVEARSHVQHLDLAAVIELHHAVSGELVLEQLIKRLMTAVLEHAGAVRGLVLLAQGGDLQIAAEAVTGHNSVIVHLRHQAMTLGELPRSVLNYVIHTQEYVIVDDATIAEVYSNDDYVRRIRPRAILCLPLIKQTRLVGVLYLENTLSPGVFTADRVTVLQLLASQAAISIENAMLFRDIQRAQDQERIRVEELRRSFDMIPNQAWRATPDGAVDFVNRPWLEYSGMLMEEVRAGKWAEVFHPDDRDKVWAEWRRCLTSGKPGEVEARMRRFDGEYRMFLVRALPMLDEQGIVRMWHGTNTDIESIRRAEEAQESLARASRLTAMGELTVSIAHEMSQPLMAIETNATTCLRWLAEGHFNPSQARQAADRIIGDVHRARDVIASIRAMARKAAPTMLRLDLNSLIAETLDLTRNEIDRHGISLTTHLEGTAEILGVRVQLQQVLLNLTMNAIEAIAAAHDTKRLLRIESVSEGDQLLVSVIDTGTGVEPANREKIFDPFFTSKPEGLGMGLSICRSIVEAHGGRLWVQANPARGSIFKFTIPLVPPETVSAIEQSPQRRIESFEWRAPKEQVDE